MLPLRSFSVCNNVARTFAFAAGRRGLVTASARSPLTSTPSILRQSPILRQNNLVRCAQGSRTYRFLAEQAKEAEHAKGKGGEKTSKDLGNEKQLTVAEQRKKDWNIIKKLLINIWPPGDWSVKSRVVFGVALLVGAKVCNIPLNIELVG